jgi:hypothetical protein
MNNQPFATRNLSGGTSKAATDTPRRRLTSLPITTGIDDQDDQDDRDYDRNYGGAAPQSPGPAEYSSAASSSSASSSSPAQSRIIRRPPRFQGNDGRSFGNNDDDDEDVEPAFLPYTTKAGSLTTGPYDLSATLRGSPQDSGKRRPKESRRDRIHHSQTSDSSTSSVPVSRGTPETRRNGPLSPRRTTELAGQSPGSRSKVYSQDSNGGSSDESSFILEGRTYTYSSMRAPTKWITDGSVTQSALESAYASNFQDGTIASLGTTITRAFRSRYQ